MEFTTFVRKPFTVEAVEITEANIGDVAEFVGELGRKEDGQPFIKVDRERVPNLYRVYPGFWMTRMGDNIRCYSKRSFANQFTIATPELEGMIRVIENGGNATKKNVFTEEEASNG